MPPPGNAESGCPGAQGLTLGLGACTSKAPADKRGSEFRNEGLTKDEGLTTRRRGPLAPGSQRLIPKRPSQHLAHHRLRQLSPEFDSSGDFVGREFLATKGAQVRFVRRFALAKNYPRVDRFAFQDRKS